MLCYGGPIKLLAAVWSLCAGSALLNRFRSLNLFSALLPEILISFEAATVIMFACFWNLVVFPCKMNFKLRALLHQTFHELALSYFFLAPSLSFPLAPVPTHPMLELYKPARGFLIRRAVVYLWASTQAGSMWCQAAASPPSLPSACRIFIHLSSLDQPLRKLSLIRRG